MILMFVFVYVFCVCVCGFECGCGWAVTSISRQQFFSFPLTNSHPLSCVRSHSLVLSQSLTHTLACIHRSRTRTCTRTCTYLRYQWMTAVFCHLDLSIGILSKGFFQHIVFSAMSSPGMILIGRFLGLLKMFER